MGTAAVLLCQPTIRPVGVEYLKAHANVIMAPDGAEDTIISYINEHKCAAIVTRTERITKRVVDSCPSLRVVGQHGIGLDNIDLEAATAAGVRVLHVPDATYQSVAEHAAMFLLALSRDLYRADANVRSGNWVYRESHFPMEVMGKTVLIIGVGRIGGALAKRLSGFDMNLLGYDIYLDRETLAAKGVTKVETLEEALPQADFVTCHVPLTPLTRHMISRPQLKLMKPGAYLMNLARGPVVEQEALAEALQNRTIAGAALDVFEQEPATADNPLLALDNIMVTPHFAGDTLEGKNRCSTRIAETVIATLAGEDTYNWANRF